jgi:hypothetical protein
MGLSYTDGGMACGVWVGGRSERPGSPSPRGWRAQEDLESIVQRLAERMLTPAEHTNFSGAHAHTATA